jgi:S-adenosylmethionine decarboxylase
VFNPAEDFKEEREMKKLGRHLIAEFADCNGQKLADVDFIEDCLNEAVRKSGATIVRSVFHRYNPQGVSGVIVIAESHLSIHTWPEYNYAAVDFFTCGDSVDPYKAYEYMKQMLDSKTSHLNELDRGIPSEEDEVLSHKPVSLRPNKPVSTR